MSFHRPQWQVSLSFHILPPMKSLPFSGFRYMKGYPFRAEPPRIGLNGSTPRGHEDTSLLYSVDVLYIFGECNNRPSSRCPLPPSLQAVKVWWDKSDVTWLLRGQTSDKLFQYKKPRSSLFILDDRKWTTFYIEDEMTLWVKVIIVTF